MGYRFNHHIQIQSYGQVCVQQYGQEPFMMVLCLLMSENRAVFKQKLHIWPSTVLKACH